MMKRFASVGILLALALATPAGAGIGEGNGEIGFDLGFTDFDSNTADDSGGRFVFRGGYHFTDWFELEGEVSASATEEDFGVDVTLSTVFVNAVFNIHPQNDQIVPFFLIGIGNADLEVDFGPWTIDDSSSAYQFAGGSRFFFGRTHRAAFRIEFSVMGEDTFDDSSTHTSLTGGFTWRLGEEP